MASEAAPISSPPATSHPEITNVSQSPIQRQTDELPSSTPVEMSQLHSQPYPQDDPSTSGSAPTFPRLPPEEQASELQPSTMQQWAPTTVDGHVDQSSSTNADDTLPTMPAPPQPAAIRNEQIRSPSRSRAESGGIGPSLDGPIVATEASGSLAVLITILLTTGARHPYTIDQKYLRRRNVASASQDIDPFSISVYTLKELIWRDWREEWDPRPTSPSSIRLIHFGKLLEDKNSLKDCRFQPSTPNVVHMTVKPQEIVDDEENAKSGKGARRGPDDGERESGCNCCIIQ